MRVRYPGCYVFFIAFLFSVGCGSDPAPDQLQGRLNAAIEISASSQRDSALAAVAKDAGTLGDSEVAKNAVSRISTPSMRSSTAATVAIALAKAGQSEAAVEVAKQIDAMSQRNRVLEQIAED